MVLFPLSVVWEIIPMPSLNYKNTRTTSSPLKVHNHLNLRRQVMTEEIPMNTLKDCLVTDIFAYQHQIKIDCWFVKAGILRWQQISYRHQCPSQLNTSITRIGHSWWIVFFLIYKSYASSSIAIPFIRPHLIPSLIPSLILSPSFSICLHDVGDNGPSKFLFYTISSSISGIIQVILELSRMGRSKFRMK